MDKHMNLIKIRVEITEQKTETQWRKISETQSWFFEKMNKIDKPLAWLIQKKRKKYKLPISGMRETI